MSVTTTTPASGVLANVLWPPKSNTGAQHWLRLVLLAVAGSIAMLISAKVQVPFWPVPLTFQTMVALLIGFAYGPRLGAATVVFYLAQGAVGLPVFANTPERGIGIAYMLGPTGGYLVGFAVAAFLTGLLAQKGWDRRAATVIAGMVIGNLAIYALGIAWLGGVIGWDKPVLQLGLYPFLLGDALKIALAAALLPAAWHLTRRSK